MGNEYRRLRRERYASTEENETAVTDHRLLNSVLLQCLGEADYGDEAGRIGSLNQLAGSGALISEGVVLTHEFHRRFLDTSGVVQAIRESVSARGDIRRVVRTLRRKYGKVSIEGELNRMVCDAIIGLGARTVTVISEDVTRSGLRSIPEAHDAVRKAWLSVNGLKRQIESAKRGEEIPTWPILILRETH